MHIIWYGGKAKPLSKDELDQYIHSLKESRGVDDTSEIINDLKELCKNDDGKSFYMVNLMKFKTEYNEELGMTPLEAHKMYSKGITKELFKRAGHPIFLSKVTGTFIKDSDSSWNEVGIIRYRSKRDMLKMILNFSDPENLNLSMMLTRKLGFYAGYGLTHYSNGRIQMPHKGVNNWGLILGMHCLLAEPVTEFIYNEPPEFKRTESIQLMCAVGIVEGIVTGTGEELQFFTSSFSADYAYQFSTRGAVTFGLDIFYDGSLKRAIKVIPPEDVTNGQQMYLGSHLGYQFIVERFTLLVNLGTYYRQHSYDRGYYYARAGGRYQFHSFR